MRPFAAVVAILSLARLSLSGVAAPCPATTHSSAQHAHAAPTTEVTHHQPAASEPASDHECASAQGDCCPAMSSCATTFLSTRAAASAPVTATQAVAVASTARALDITRAPEPPPPRA